MNAIRKSAWAAPAVAGAMVLGMAALNVPIAHANDMHRSTVVVHFADVDAKTPSGANQVFWRLVRASEQVCGENSEGVAPPLSIVLNLQACEQKAIAPAVEKINTQPLTAIYYRHYSMPLGTVEIGPIGRG
jgi:UrcA family protein